MKPTQRPRALRKPFMAAVVITDLASERQMAARTSDLSVQGCFVATPAPLNSGVKVRVTMVHAGARLVALGRVVFARTDGMGITFTKIEPRDQAVLERLMSGLRRSGPPIGSPNRRPINDEIRAYIDRLKPQWHAFLEQLADAEFPHANPVGWRTEDEAWRDTFRHLDRVAAAYVAWQGRGRTMNEWGPIDDQRLIELIEPYLRNEADRRLFLATCQGLMQEWRKLNPPGT